MKKYLLPVLSLLCSLTGLVLCCISMASEGEHSLSALGLLFVNLGLWPNIIINRKNRKDGDKHE